MPASRSAENARLSASVAPSSSTTQRTPPARPDESVRPSPATAKCSSTSAASENRPTPASSSGERASSSRSLRASSHAARRPLGGRAHRVSLPRCSVSATLQSRRPRSWSCVAMMIVALPAHALDQPVEQLGAARVEAGVRLVEQQQIGRGGERACDPEPLALPLREVARPHVGAVGEPDALEARAADARARGRTAGPSASRFSPAVRPPQTSGRCERKPIRRRSSGGAFIAGHAVDPRLAAQRPQQPGDHAHERRLARAVLAEQRERRGGADLELDAAQDREVAELVLDPVELDDRRRHGRCAQEIAASSATAARYRTAIAPLTEKKAASTRERSSGCTIAFSYASSTATSATPT